MYLYYKLRNEKNFHATGQAAYTKAENFVVNLIEQNKRQPVINMTLKEYADPYYVWETCPHVRRLLDEKKSIGKRHVRIQRGVMENHIFPDKIVNMKISDIRRADIIDFRSRLLAKDLGGRTVNMIIGILKTIFKEAFYREEIDRDPTAGIGLIKYRKKEAGIFTITELKMLFPLDSIGVWKSKLDYTCFFLACVTGMRRGELLALQWKHINFEIGFLNVKTAWKDKDEIGLPKWNRIRKVPLPVIILEKLKDLNSESIRCLPDDLVFCYDDGTRLGDTWWTKRFAAAMKKANIDKKARNLKPHSFRHTLNTILRDSGEDNAKIRATLGWLSEDIQENYTHWEVEHLQEQAAIIDHLWQ